VNYFRADVFRFFFVDREARRSVDAFPARAARQKKRKTSARK